MLYPVPNEIGERVEMDPLVTDDVLKRLWRWKLLTTAALHELHFSHLSPKTSYKELWKMRKRGIVRLAPDHTGRRFAFSLTKKGFSQISFPYADFHEKGYRSEHFEHDLITTAIHLGDWMHGVPDGHAMFSEQQLRRIYFEQFPGWVPRSKYHRPDGFWRVPYGDQDKVFALEVELTLKRELKYAYIGDHYDESSRIDRVVWLVRTSRTAAKIDQYLQEKARKKSGKHHFVLLDDLLVSGWMAKLHHGIDAGKTLNWLLNGGVEKTPKKISSLSLLDTRKSGVLAGPCKTLHFRRELN